jgi:pimeloyl-ACP methyl ester carboxylesterase
MPVLLVHGLGGNFTHWEHLVPRLAETRRVIGLDLPGCGDSHKLPSYSIRAFADALVQLLDFLEIPRAIAVGHSLGGGVVAEAALAHAPRLERIVIIDAAGFRRYPAVLKVASRLLHPKVVAPVMERVARRLLDNVFHERNELTARFVGQAEGREPYPTLSDFADMACSVAPDLVGRCFLDDVERILQPALVIWGDRDRLVPFQGVERWTARLPAGRLVVVRGCGHMPIIERPRAVLDAIDEFLAPAAARSRRSGGA